MGMKIVAYLDNDELNKPSTGTSEVYALSSGNSPLTQEQLIQKYPKVFSEGVGQLESEYHIRLNSQIDPIQHAPATKSPSCVKGTVEENARGTGPTRHPRTSYTTYRMDQLYGNRAQEGW